MQALREAIPIEAPATSGAVDRRHDDGAAPSAGERTIVRIEGLTKRFGSMTAVDQLHLEVRAGEVVGLLGPNGAGKTTTVGMILGLIAPTAGRIEILGQDLATHRRVERREVGAIIEQPAFYPYLSGRDNLRAIGLAAGGVPTDWVERLLALVGLTERGESPYKTYSLGMKQRLGIASTLLTNPALVILDEPTNGLDPAGQREMRELIPTLAQEGHGVLLASHLLHEVQQVANRVVIIRRGTLLASGTVRDLLQRDSFLEIEISNPERAAEVVRSLPFVREVVVRGGALAVHLPPERGADVSRALAKHGAYPSTMVPRTGSLEDVFLELTEAPTERRDSNGSSAPQ